MLTKEELKNAHNNVMTIMENRIMQMTNCDRATANLVANEILDLDRESEQLLTEDEEKGWTFFQWLNAYEFMTKREFKELPDYKKENYKREFEMFKAGISQYNT